MKTRWFAMLLAVAMLLTCLPMSALAADPYQKYDKPVTVTVVKGVTVATDTEDRTENNNFIKFIEDNYGIKLEYK